MPIVTSKEMFKKAYEGGYAIGAFNVNNMEIIQGITEAAKAVNSPLILQVNRRGQEVCQARLFNEAYRGGCGGRTCPSAFTLTMGRTLKSASPVWTGLYLRYD